MYTIQTEQFSGPIEKLLQLIEERKLEVVQVSLAAVTDDFLKFVDRMGADGKERTEEEMRFLSDFVAVASRLLLIKSKALLPSLELSAEEQEDIRDLEDRLKFYQQFKPAMTHMKACFATDRHLFARPLLLGRPAIFYPSPDLTPQRLHAGMIALFETMQQTKLELATVENTVIKLETKIEEVLSRVTEGVQRFGNLLKEGSKGEIVVTFLALLHLLRDQRIRVEQHSHFGEMTIDHKDGTVSL